MNNNPSPLCEAYKAISAELRRRGIVDGAFIGPGNIIAPIPLAKFFPFQAANDE
jgi:hypothetical protein